MSEKIPQSRNGINKFHNCLLQVRKKTDVLSEAVVQLLHYSNDSRSTEYDIVEMNNTRVGILILATLL